MHEYIVTIVYSEWMREVEIEKDERRTALHSEWWKEMEMC